MIFNVIFFLIGCTAAYAQIGTPIDVAFGHGAKVAQISIDRLKKPYRVIVKWNNRRPAATGEIDETNGLIQTGFVNFPDDRKYRFWYHTDEAKIYWDADKGRTKNIWTGGVKSKEEFFECGIPDVIGTRVVGGVTAKRGAWPWQVLLKFGGRAGCGGTLIAPNWVVTAAHCVYRREKYPYLFSVVVGEHDREVAEGSEEEIKVEKVYRYPNYDPRHLDNDIAMLKLKKPAKFGKYVKPACLPTDFIPVGAHCYITGWGKMHHPGSMVRWLQQGILPVVSNKVCEYHNKKVIPIPVTASMICGGSGGTLTTSGCHGDSGGPFVCKVNGRWELHGAVSYGSPRCKSTETYTVFARTFHFKTWIAKVMQN